MNAPPSAHAGGHPVHLADLLHRLVTDRDTHTLGNPVDVIARLRCWDRGGWVVSPAFWSVPRRWLWSPTVTALSP